MRWRCSAALTGISIDKADFVAGHSLGEYSALCAAGSFDLPTTAKLLKLRGQAMQAAVPVGEGRWRRCSAPTSSSPSDRRCGGAGRGLHRRQRQ
jgi:acyl transferase domain-containing protein